MFRSLRTLIGFGAQKKLNRKQNKFFKNVKMTFDALEDRTVPATVPVSAGNVGAWAFDVRDDQGVVNNNPTAGGGFVAGPVTPPAGTGSALLFTGNGVTGGDGAAELRNSGYNGVLLSQLTSLSYGTFATSWNGQQLPYLALEIDWDGDQTIEDRIFFEPAFQTPASGNASLPDQGDALLATWQNWDAFSGGWWSNLGTAGANPGTDVKPLSDYIAAVPTARIINPSVSGLGGVRLQVGFASPADEFNGNVDNVTIGVAGVDTTFDFENTPPAIVYVDSSWTNVNPGVDPDGNGPATVFGGDAFATIAAAVDAVAINGTVKVAAGTYPEGDNAIHINKSMTITGPNALVSPNGVPARNPEAIITSQGTDINPNTVFSVDGSNLTVKVEGFKFDGTPSVMNAYSPFDTVTLQKNIFTGTHDPGMYFETPTDLIVNDNLFTDILAAAQTEDTIFVGQNFGVDRAVVHITDNVWNNIGTAGLNLSNVSGVISGNTFKNVVYYGVLLAYDSGDLSITGNTFDGITNPDPVNVPTWGSGIRFYEPSTTDPVTISGNTFKNSVNGVGIRRGVGDSDATSPIDITGLPINILGNTFTNNTNAIYHNAAGILDATGGNTFNIVDSATASAAQLYAIEDNIYHGTDKVNRGLVRIRANQVYVTSGSGSVQRGVDVASSSGDTINIQSGFYSGPVDATGKAITLAAGSSPGQVFINGNLKLSNDDKLEIEIAGINPVSQFDNFAVSGTVTLDNAELSVVLSFSPIVNQPFTILNKTLSGAIPDTFFGKAEGDTFLVGAYTFKISYTGGTGNDIVLTNLGIAPVITSNLGGGTASVSIAENTVAVTTVTATDADLPAQALTYSISGGADASKFTIHSTSGVLTFVAAPDFETPSDVGGNNVYEVTVQVNDGNLVDTQDISVTVTAENDNTPTITSNLGGATATVNVSENTIAVTTVTATDNDLPAQSLTYSISGGADALKFTIGSTSGVLTFVSAPDYELPTDVGGNNVYEVTVMASDGTLFDSQDIAVTVLPENDNTPVITSNLGGATATVSIAENTNAVTTVVATDDDLPALALTYSISGGADALKFTIGSTSGVLTFVSAPDYELPSDVGGNNVYEVTVVASDGTLFDSQDIAVTVTAENDNTPVITSNLGGPTATVSIAENTTAVTTVLASDADVPAQTLTYSISGGADASKFTINSASGVLKFAATPNFEAPSDDGGNNVYEVTVLASDGTLFDSQDIAVTVTDGFDTPVITSNGGGATAAVNVAENVTAVTMVTAADDDLPPQALTFSISGGADALKFSINSTSGALAFLTPPNFEAPTDVGANNVYEVTVQVSDGASTDTQAIFVTVTPVNDNTPVINSNGGGSSAALNIAEGTTAVTIVTATDLDLPPQGLTYSISGGADALKFTINSTSGALAFVTPPNFEAPTDVGANNVYEVTVQVSDGSLTDSQDITVTVTPENNNAPVITSNGGGPTAALSISENTTAVTTVSALDSDLPPESLTYSISGGADAAKFSINSSSGALVFLAPPDFEAPTDFGGNNVYEVTVQVSDGILTDSQIIEVTVTGVNDNTPSISSNSGGATAAVSISENTTAVTTVTATDADVPAPTFAYSISGGADAAKFGINSSTGELTFLTAPNFEAPTDTGANNSYEVTVQVSDGSLIDTQAITVTVTDANEAPAITSNGGGAAAALNVTEGTTAVTTVTAADPDATPSLTFSISGGLDAAKFTINASTGALAFLIAPDFGSPTDSGANNVYDVIVQVSDGSLTDTQAIAVTILDGNPNIVVNGTGGNDTLVLTATPGSGSITYVLNSDPAVVLTGVTSFTFNGLGGNDTFDVSLPSTGILVSGNVAFNGGGGSNTLIFDANNQSMFVTPGVFTADEGQTTTFTNVNNTSLNDAFLVNTVYGANTDARSTAFIGLTPDQRFVQAMYLSVLRRPGTVSELDGWVSVMRGQGGSQALVVNAIETSFEARNNQVKTWYNNYLGRDANGTEQLGWVNALTTLTEEQVLSAILASDEYLARAQTEIPTGTSTGKYVALLYKSLLNRAATADEIAGWVNVINVVGRQVLPTAFLNSQEFRTYLFESYYVTLLHRPSDLTGLAGWVGSGLDQRTARIGFKSSPEFYLNG